MEVCIAGDAIGAGQPCWVIAEAGVNHNGDANKAHELVEAAARAGANAVKFQTFKAEKLVSKSAPQAEYQKKNAPEVSQWEMLKKLELPISVFQELAQHAQQRGLVWLSTAFDEESADQLAEMQMPAWKIPSGEITNLPFLAKLAATGKPLLISTGMCNLGDVEAAVETVERAGGKELVLLHCVSSYPAPAEAVNLKAMKTLAETFGYPVGYSDHTLGCEVAWAAVALGACVLEKHFTLDNKLPGPDHAASLEPEELKALMKGIRTIEAAMGDGRKRPAEAERDTAAVARKSLVATQTILAGELFTSQNFDCLRPGTGLPPKVAHHFLGRAARRQIAAGEMLTWDMVE